MQETELIEKTNVTKLQEILKCNTNGNISECAK